MMPVLGFLRHGYQRRRLIKRLRHISETFDISLRGIVRSICRCFARLAMGVAKVAHGCTPLLPPTAKCNRRKVRDCHKTQQTKG